MTDFDPTRWIRALIAAIGFAHPIRLMVSFALAQMLFLIVAAMRIDFPNISLLGVFFENRNAFVFSVTFLLAFWRVIGRPMAVSDNTSNWLDSIEETLSRSSFSQVEKRKYWETVLAKLIDSIDLRSEIESMKSKESIGQDQNSKKANQEKLISDEDLST